MQHRNPPRGFDASQWRRLYDAGIHSKEEVKQMSDNAIFVVFDAEPWGGDTTKAAEVGISILRAPYHKDGTAFPTALAEFAESYGIETHRIQIIEMQSNRKSEAHRFGQEHRVASIDVEHHIMNLVGSYIQRVAPDSEQVVLVGFALQFEFRLLSTIYTRLANYFASWLDLQELSSLASRMRTPGLSMTLKACGFGLRDSTDLQPSSDKHNAATDTVRAAAVFHSLLARDDDQELQIGPCRNEKVLARPPRPALPPRPKHFNIPEDRKLWYGPRPNPVELYPYIARVKRSKKQYLTPQALLETFAAYDPVAVGTPRQCAGHRYGWVCLPSLGALKQFVKAVDGSEHPEGGIWKAVSRYDPDIIPAKDMCELQEQLLARIHAKREERRTKRLAGETETHLETLKRSNDCPNLLRHISMFGLQPVCVRARCSSPLSMSLYLEGP